MLRTILLTGAAAIALAMPVHAEDTAKGAAPQSGFSNTMNAIKGWFGSEKPADAKTNNTDTATMEQKLDIWFGEKDKKSNVAPQDIEPAAGGDDDLQVPPPYNGPQSNAAPVGKDRATAFDGNASMAAFNDVQEPSAADVANIAPAAGDDAQVDMAKVDCKAVLKAAESKEEGAELPDTAIIEACETSVDASGEPVKDPAQPAFEDGTPTQQGELPSTQPAAGEPPIGEAVMPGEKH